jgi:hypothetical protein
MNKKSLKFKKIKKVKSHLIKNAPCITDVDVKISNLNNGKYKSKIYVHIPSKKKIVTTKVDESLRQSLEKAHKAALKQIHRCTKPKIKRHSIRKIDQEEVA